MKEIPISGQFYRVLVDEANKIWHRISFWTKANDVQFDDGSFLSEKSFGHCMVERSKKYNNGDIVYCENAPSWAMFMCSTPGITAKTEPLEYKTVQLPGTMVTDGTAEFLVMDVRPATTVSSNQCQAPSMNNLKVISDNVTDMMDSPLEGKERFSNVNVYVGKDEKLHFTDNSGRDTVLDYKTHMATYTFATEDIGTIKDLGEVHKYRYINAENVYTKGVQDGLVASADNIKKIEYTYHHHTQTNVNVNDNNQAACPLADDYKTETKGGCFTKPYYYYSVFHQGASHRILCNGGYREVGYGSREDVGGSFPIYECTICGWRQVGGKWGSEYNPHYRTTKDPDYTTNHYGYSVPSGGKLLKTYYVRNCGFTNGQIVQQKIHFN